MSHHVAHLIVAKIEKRLDMDKYNIYATTTMGFDANAVFEKKKVGKTKQVVSLRGKSDFITIVFLCLYTCIAEIVIQFK